MKIELDNCAMASFDTARPLDPVPYCASETDVLTDVLVCRPKYLVPIPCCSVTKQSLARGHATSVPLAEAQHLKLTHILEAEGVRCHFLEPVPNLPDMCFTRDIGVATPFGHFALNPAMSHRREEVAMMKVARPMLGLASRTITSGTLEGGDICVAREGLLLIGTSGERTSHAGLEEFTTPFRAAGWEVAVCPFHGDYLHLDTIFCMVSENQALACVELLDTNFVETIKALGIQLLCAPAHASRSLACNILALGDGRILASSADATVICTLKAAGLDVITIDVSEFAACGGGIHCLTQPLRRTSL